MFRRLALCTVVLASAAGPGWAETIDKTVKANSRTVVGSIVTYNVGQCEGSVVPTARLRRPPANGTVAIEVRQGTLGRDSRCPGISVRGPVFVYAPAKGFRGTDEFEIDFPFARTEVRMPTVFTNTYRIKVE